MRLTLHQLQVFETVARQGRFGRAAEELHLAQPTVSMQVKQLADAVGLPLFEQVGKKPHLTEAGEIVRTGARQVFDAVAQMEARLAGLKGLEQGRLRIAVVTTAKYFIPRLLGVFARHHPGIDIALDVGNRSEILARLSRNEDDLCIMGVPPVGAAIVRHPFVENPIVAIAPPDHPLAGQRRIALARLAEESFLLRERGSGTRLATERFLKENGISLRIRMELGSNEAIKQAVAGGLGLSLLSLHALGAELARGELALLDVAGLPIQRSWYVVHRAGKALSLAAQTFFQFLKEEGPVLQRQLQQAQMSRVPIPARASGVRAPARARRRAPRR